MLVRQGDARSHVIDRRLAAILAATAGAVNTAAFQAVGFFAANMTGNISFASDKMAFGQFPAAGLYLLIVATFIAGAAVCTLLVSLGQRRRMHGIYALTILAEAGCMALLSLIDPLLAEGWRGPVLVVGLSFLMGHQNAAATRISNGRVRTTHVSGMATDIGIGLGLLLDIARGREPEAEAASVRARLQLHGLTVLSFLVGGLVGVLAYRAVGSFMLLGCAGLLVAVALPEAIKAKALVAQP
jgi:uncharacterized membrane protein YoaK (UPF0700 family)